MTEQLQFDASQLDWQKVDGLMPAIVQDVVTGEVLMQGFLNQEALAETLKSGHVTFFSRTKGRLWTKGESSGHFLNLKAISTDCDNDCLLIAAEPVGPTCHKGTVSCFDGHPRPPLAFLAELEQLLAARKGADPETSYTARLYAKGTKRIAQKVGEEGVEVALAAHGQGSRGADQRVRRPALSPDGAAAKRRPAAGRRGEPPGRAPSG